MTTIRQALEAALHIDGNVATMALVSAGTPQYLACAQSLKNTSAQIRAALTELDTLEAELKRLKKACRAAVHDMQDIRNDFELRDETYSQLREALESEARP